MLKIKFLSILSLIILFLICPADAKTINITAYEDTWTNADAEHTNDNYGSSNTFICANGDQYISFIKFNVPQYTDGAYLHLYVEDTGGGYANVYQIAPSLWSENTLTALSRPVGWDTIYINQSDTVTGHWTVIDVSSSVSYAGNYSYSIESSGNMVTFTSSEGDSSHTPYLEIHTASKPLDINWNNKTNDDDKAFLVNTSEVVRFNITAPDSSNISNYVWSVNKTKQSTNINSFDFTVPSFDVSHPYTGIWEIRIDGTYQNRSKITREWLISALTEDQAPDYLDFFVDLENNNRHETDPWGRDPPAYQTTTSNEISNGLFIGDEKLVDDNFGIEYGTFRFKMRSLTYDSIGIQASDSDSSWGIDYEGTGTHDYFNLGTWAGYTPISKKWLGQAPGDFPLRDDGWKQCTVIVSDDGWWYSYVNDSLSPKAVGHFPDELNNVSYFHIMNGGDNELDDIEVYENKFIYPPTNITYGTYSKWWDWHGNYEDAYGIIVYGRDLTLKNISTAINNDSLITYDDATKTATIKTNLFINAGSQLNITNETLLFDTTEKSLFIRPDAGVTLRIKNSTISTTSNNPMIWNFVSFASKTIFAPVDSRLVEGEVLTHRGNPSEDFRGRFIVENSTLNNTCNLFLEGAHEIVLNNTILSNLSSSAYGKYEESTRTRSYLHYLTEIGNKSLYIVPRLDLANYTLNNVSFKDPGADVILEIRGGEWIVNSTFIENSDFSNVPIRDKKAMKQEFHIGYWNQTEHSDLSLLNCKYNESKLDVQTDKAKIETKYYADVFVKNENNAPVQNALITLTASNAEYGAECLYKYESYFNDYPGDLNAKGPGAGGSDTPGYRYTAQNITYSGGAWKRWYNAQPLTSATTNSNGHTALPNEDVNNSIVLTDKVFTNETGIQSKESIRYNLTISPPNSRPICIQDVAPDSTWYRDNILSSKYTITAIVPDNSSKGPHIIGFSPAADNPFNIGEKKNFRVWTDGNLTEMKWTVDGTKVTAGTLNYTWKVIGGSHTIEFSGIGTNGTTVSQIWKLGVGASNQTSIVKFLPENNSLTKNINESVTFSVNSSQLLTKKWYINGTLAQNNTTTVTKSWNTSGIYNVTFSGSTGKEPVTNTWIVNVTGSSKSQKESIISITPEYQVVSPKKQFALNIRVEPGTAITGTQSDLLFQSSMVMINKVSEGNLFSQNSSETHFINGTVNTSTGLIKQIYGSIIGNSNVSSPGTLAIINLTANNITGIAKFNLSNVIVSDFDSRSVPNAIKNATVLIDTAPILSPIGSKSVYETKTLTFKVNASDADGNKLNLSASGIPSGAIFNQTTSTFSWTPSKGQAGNYSVTFKVSDGYLTNSQTAKITVKRVNNSPVITYFEPVNGSVFNEGEKIKIVLNASDADNQTLNYSIKIDGAVCSTTSSYVWNTNYSSSGNHTIEIAVNDGVDTAKKVSIISIYDYHPRWDAKKDGTVNILDITTIAQKYGITIKSPYPDWDVNQDGKINLDDLILTGSHFGEKIELETKIDK